MKLADRQLVEGTYPRIYIGHRVYVDASTGRRCISRRWYSEWNENGVKRSEALKTTNKQTAIRKAHKIAERIGRGELPEPSSETLVKLKEAYLATLTGRGRAPKTIQKYTNILHRFAEHASEQKVVFARQYMETHFWAFSQQLMQESLSPKTRHNYLTIIKQVFRWAARNRRIPANPLEHAKLDEPGDSKQPVLTAADVSLLLQRADPHEAAIYAFLAYTGARFGEARDVTWDDLLTTEGKHGFVVIRRGVLGAEHPGTLTSINNMGALLSAQGRHAEGEELGAKAVATAQRVLPPGHWYTAVFLSRHAQTLALMERFADAEERAIEAHAIFEAALGEKHERTIDIINQIADLYTAWHSTELNAGHDIKAAEWRARLEQARAPTSTEDVTADREGGER